MKKGCIIAVVVVVVLAALGIGGCFFFGMKYGSKWANAGVAFAIETAIELYRSEHPDGEVSLSNEAWAEKLRDYQMPGAGNQNLSQFIKNGKLVDLFQREVRLEQDADGKIRVRSAGKDGLMDTEDDVTSEFMQKLQKKLESAVEEPAPPELEASAIESGEP